MRRFLRGLSAITIVNVINGALGVIIVPLAVKRLGIEGYGLYSIFSVLAGYLVLIELGLGKNLVRLLGATSSEVDARNLLRLALGLYVAIAATLIVLAPLLIPAAEAVLFRVSAPFIASVYWIAAIAILDYLLGIPVSIRLNYALSQERIGEYARFMLLSNASRYALMLAGVLLSTHAEVAVAFVLGRRLVDLMAAPRMLPALPPGAWRPRLSWTEARALIGQSSLLAATQLLQLSTVAVGSVMVNRFFGLAALGIYRSAFDVVSKVWFFSNTAGLVLYPRFIQLLRRPESRQRLGRLLPDVQNASWLVYCVAAVGGVSLAGFILSLMRLDKTPPFLFSLLMVGVLWNAHSAMSTELLQAGGYFRRVGEAAAVSFVSMTAVFLLLAGRWPVFAIGWAWVVSQFFSATLTDALAVRQLRGSCPVGALARTRIPAAILTCVALAWQGGRWLVPSVVLGIAALVVIAADVPKMWRAFGDLSGGEAALVQS